MNAQQTTSVVNLISVQPATTSPSGAGNDAPRFAEVLGRQQNLQQPKPAAPAKETTKAAPAGNSGNANGSATAQPAPESTQSQGQSEASAALDAPAENSTAMAMSDLATAVASVFLAREGAKDTAGLITADDETDPSKRLNIDALKGFDDSLSEKSFANTSHPDQDKASSDARLKFANPAESAKALPSDAESGALLQARQAGAMAASNDTAESQYARRQTAVAAMPVASSVAPTAAMGNLNQTLQGIDREARVNTFTRNLLDNKQTTVSDLKDIPGLDAGLVDGIDPDFKPDFDEQLLSATDRNAQSNTLHARGNTTIESDALDATSVPRAEIASTGVSVPVTTAATPGSLGAPMISTPLGHPKWGNDFSQQVAGLTQNIKTGPQTIEMRLDPPDLGPIRISISLNDGVAQAMFVSPHANVRNAVENALPQLQQQLAQSGISLGQTSVSDQGQTQQQGTDSNGSGTKTNNSLASTAGVAENATPVQNVRVNPTHNGQINTFA